MKRLISLALSTLLLTSLCLAQGKPTKIICQDAECVMANSNLTVGGNAVLGSGTMTGNLLPNVDGSGSIGSSAKGWASLNISDGLGHKVFIDPTIIQPNSEGYLNLGDASHGLASLHTGDGTGGLIQNFDASHNAILKVTSAHGLILGSNNVSKWTIPSAAAGSNTLEFDVAATATAAGVIRAATADADDDAYLDLTGGGAVGAGRGARLTLYGNEVATTGASAYLSSARSGSIILSTGRTSADTTVPRVTLPAVDDVDNVDIVLGSNATTAPAFVLRAATSDGDDDGVLDLAAGGGAAYTRGAYIEMLGNETAANGGALYLTTGQVAGAAIRLQPFGGSGAGGVELYDGNSFGAGLFIRSMQEEVTIAVGAGAAGTVSATNLCPSGIIVGASARITDAPGGGATTIDVGCTGSGNLDQLIDGVGTGLGTTGVYPTNGDGTNTPWVQKAATTATITTDVNVAGDEMKVRVITYYLASGGPSS